MTNRDALEALLLAHHEWVARSAAAICRRHGMGEPDAEDFASWVTLRLVEDDYAVLRQFRGDSSLRTYLTVVIVMLHREYRVRCWGRWRPSAAARRAGDGAVRLETLVYRDGLTLREAAELLRVRGELPADGGGRSLARLLATLPRRTPRPREEPGAVPVEAAAVGGADDLVRASEADAERRAIDAALRRGLEALPAEDRLVVWLHYWEGLTLAEVARRLDVPQKPLYRRMARALVRLRRVLEAAGVSPSRVRAAIEGAAA